MKKCTHMFVLFAALLLMAGYALAADAPKDRTHPLSKEEVALSKEAKISFEEAKKIAIEKEPGKVFNWELEKEDGKLIYSILVQLPDDKTYCREVNVDGNTGKIVADEKEDLKTQLQNATSENENESEEGENDKD